MGARRIEITAKGTNTRAEVLKKRLQSRGFSKGDLGYNDEERAKIAVRYIEGTQRLLGNILWLGRTLRSSHLPVISFSEQIFNTRKFSQ